MNNTYLIVFSIVLLVPASSTDSGNKWFSDVPQMAKRNFDFEFYHLSIFH